MLDGMLRLKIGTMKELQLFLQLIYMYSVRLGSLAILQLLKEKNLQLIEKLKKIMVLCRFGFILIFGIVLYIIGKIILIYLLFRC